MDEKTSMSIILSQADIDVLVNEGGLVICGNGLTIKGVELCSAIVVDCEQAWAGETAISWDPSTAMGALSWGGYDWSTAKPEMKLTVRFAKTEGAEYTNLRFGNGSWAALPTTLADPASSEDGT